jgi:hypothetical protein
VNFAPIPDSFDQTKEYITQDTPIDQGDQIYLGIITNQLPPEQNNGGGMPPGM